MEPKFKVGDYISGRHRLDNHRYYQEGIVINIYDISEMYEIKPIKTKRSCPRDYPDTWLVSFNLAKAKSRKERLQLIYNL